MKERPGELQRELRRIVQALGDQGVAAAVVGGLAVSARAEPRFTRDADLAVAVLDDLEAERIVRALQHRGYRVLQSLEHLTTRRLATVRLLPPGGGTEGVIVDLLFASSGIEPEIVAAAEGLELLPGLHLPVAGIGHLLAMKLLSFDPVSRATDGQDLVHLLAEATESDLETCREAIRTIEDRGYHRGRDLPALLHRFRTP